ncbi:MAG: hypothetical protein ACREP6_14990 [Candidatus Binataceae bacterium]
MKLICAPILAFGLSCATIPIVQWIAIRRNIAATPASPVLEGSNERRRVPLLGGASIIFALLITLAIAGELPLWLALGALAMFVAGLIDDIVALKPLRKFAAQAIIAASVVAMTRRFALTPWALTDAALAFLWLLATTNAFNLIDGLDGLAAGAGIAATAAIAAIGGLHHDPALVYCSLALAGALAGFMVYNLHPASIFMGDAGALPVGLLLGVMALRGGGLAHNSNITRYLFPLLVLALPLLDTTIVTITRLATGHPISRRGLDHSHHRLLLLGLSNHFVVLICWSVAALGALCAVGMSALPHGYVIATAPLTVLVFAIIGLFMTDLSFESRPPGIAYGYVQGIARLILNVSYKRRLVEVLLDLALISGAWFAAFLLRMDFKLKEAQVSELLRVLPWVLAPAYAAFAVTGVYRGMWRYAGLSELIRFANGAAMAGVLLVLVSLFVQIPVSGSIVVLFVILLLNFLMATRMSFRALREGIHHLAQSRQRVLIVGAGASGAAAARCLFSGQNRNLKLVGFVDDDVFKFGKLVHGHRVLGSLDELERVFEKCPFDRLMIAASTLGAERLRALADFAARHRLGVSRFSIQIDEVANGSREKWLDLADEGAIVAAEPPPLGP